MMLAWIKLWNVMLFTYMLCTLYTVLTEGWAYMYLHGVVFWLVVSGLVTVFVQVVEAIRH